MTPIMLSIVSKSKFSINKLTIKGQDNLEQSRARASENVYKQRFYIQWLLGQTQGVKSYIRGFWLSLNWASMLSRFER